jgi:hypothetical protein
LQTIRNWNDLEKFGIVPLTGEACGLSMRLLCDITARGKRILQTLFGLQDLAVTLTLRPAWNGSVIRLTGGEAPEEKATHSVMLPADLLRTLAVFCLVDAGCEEIYLADGKPTCGMTALDFVEWRREHGEHALAVFEANLRMIYGTTMYGPNEYTPEPIELECWRTFRPDGPGRRRLVEPPLPDTIRPQDLEAATRNTHAMSGRTV